MNKLVLPILFIGLLFTNIKYEGSSTAPVVLAGAIVKNIGNEPVKKYPRKNCPVCKGTGKYLSGDGIKMVDCGYCIPEVKSDVDIKKSSYCKCINCVCDPCLCTERKL